MKTNSVVVPTSEETTSRTNSSAAQSTVVVTSSYATPTPNSSTTSSTCGLGGTATVGVSGPQPPCGCRYAGTVTTDDQVVLDVYVSPATKLGGTVCLYAYAPGPTTTESMTFTITNSTGTIFYQSSCIILGTRPGTMRDCGAGWSTNQSYNGIIPVAGAYLLYVNTRGYYTGINESPVNFTVY